MLTLIYIYRPHLDFGIGLWHCWPVLLGVIILTYVRPERGLIKPSDAHRQGNVIYMGQILRDTFHLSIV